MGAMQSHPIVGRGQHVALLDHARDDPLGRAGVAPYERDHGQPDGQRHARLKAVEVEQDERAEDDQVFAKQQLKVDEDEPLDEEVDGNEDERGRKEELWHVRHLV